VFACVQHSDYLGDLPASIALCHAPLKVERARMIALRVELSILVHIKYLINSTYYLLILSYLVWILGLRYP
jgi:hypothetical protein